MWILSKFYFHQSLRLGSGVRATASSRIRTACAGYRLRRR